MKYLEEKELQAVLDKAMIRGERDYLIMSLLIRSGIRVSELNKIKPQDILQEAKQIIIRGKGDKIRNVDVKRDLIIQLLGYIKKKNIKKKQRIIPLTRQRIGQITNEISGFHPHAFRHSYAILLLRTTGNIRYVQVQLGHESLTATQEYLKYYDFNKEKRKLEGMI